MPAKPGTIGEVHDLDPQAFLEEVHSFEFWFHAVEGYLSGSTWGHRPGVAQEPVAEADRERLVTVLCNYCIGETTALDGASGLIAIAPSRITKVFLATQVADEGRHLEVFLHRLRDLGVADAETEVERRGVIKDERRHIGFGENELGRRLAASPHIRARLGQTKKELDHLVLDALEETARLIGLERADQERLGRMYLGSVARLGFSS
jgi:hypothetical protein